MNGASALADVILHHGNVTTLDRSNPTATAVAIRDGRFLRVGADADVLALAGPATKIIDLKGRRVLPGLIDNHLHIIRAAWQQMRCGQHVFGAMPGRHAETPAVTRIATVGKAQS